MNNIVCKVAPKGEGKTKWLLNIAKECSDKNETVYLATSSVYQYTRFCEKYFALFNTVCPVIYYEDDTDKDSVVLIDNLVESGVNMNNIALIKNTCKTIYITVEGVLAND